MPKLQYYPINLGIFSWSCTAFLALGLLLQSCSSVSRVYEIQWLLLSNWFGELDRVLVPHEPYEYSHPVCQRAAGEVGQRGLVLVCLESNMVFHEISEVQDMMVARESVEVTVGVSVVIVSHSQDALLNLVTFVVHRITLLDVVSAVWRFRPALCHVFVLIPQLLEARESKLLPQFGGVQHGQAVLQVLDSTEARVPVALFSIYVFAPLQVAHQVLFDNVLPLLLAPISSSHPVYLDLFLFLASPTSCDQLLDAVPLPLPLSFSPLFHVRDDDFPHRLVFAAPDGEGFRASSFFLVCDVPLHLKLSLALLVLLLFDEYRPNGGCVRFVPDELFREQHCGRGSPSLDQMTQLCLTVPHIQSQNVHDDGLLFQ
jgi:hypothetical protein